MATFHEVLVDKRIIDRNIKRGALTRQDYEKHVRDLPDVADRIAPPDDEEGESEQE